MNGQIAHAPRRFALSGSVIAFFITATVLVMVPSAIRDIGSSSSFLPHATCYLYNKQLIALNLGSDAAIWLAYVSISLTLVYLVRKTRREIPFSWMFLAFGLFIVACGFTHFMEMVVLWKPLYWLAGDVKLITALASVVTAIALPGVVPQVRNMVGAAYLSEQRRSLLEEANVELKRLSSHIMTAQDSERSRIARELHDGIGQYLVAIKMSCDVAVERFKTDDGRAALEDAIKVLDRCTSDVRTLSHLLHPPLLEEMGLASVVPWYVDEFSKRSGIAVKLVMPEKMGRLAMSAELTLFRVLQEALTNIHRHSGSKTAQIELQSNGKAVSLTVEDQGKGFDSGLHGLQKSGVGIASMRERVREQDGELQITSTATGTMVVVSLPAGARS